MNEPNSLDPKPSADQLASQLLETGLSEVEQADLIALMTGDTAACDRVIQHAMLHSALLNEFGGYRNTTLNESLSLVDPSADSSNATDASLTSLNGATNSVSPSVPVLRLANRGWLGFAATAVGGLAIGAFLAVSTGWVERPQVSRGSNESVVGGTVTPIAFLTASNGCAWGSSSSQLRAVGSSIQPGDELALYEGIAEFRLASGVSLSIEGPAALVITSPSTLILQHGKLTAYVPWGMTDFKLAAGGCRVSAMDAEFGVSAAGDKLDMHVFSGKVVAEPILETSRELEITDTAVIERESDLPASADFLKAVIFAGRGISLVSQGGATKVDRWHAADTSRFATKLTMAGPLAITKDYIDQVLASKLVEYWRFEEVRDGQIASFFEHGVPLTVSGNLRLSGDSSNRAAELGIPGSDCLLVSDKPVPIPAGRHYSVEVWIKPSHAHEGSIALLLTDFAEHEQKQGAAFYLQLLRSRRRGMPEDRLQAVRFLHRDPPSSDSYLGTDCYSRNPYLVRRWQHVVAVKEDAIVKLYVDGALSDEKPDDTSIVDNLWLQLGQLNVTDHRFPFIGQLDELAIYDHAISAEEVRKHYQAVKKQNRAKVKSSI